LRGSSVLVVGAGGLGSPALLYLARAGVGRLGIVDYDRVEVDNLHRQLLYIHADIGQEKAFLAAERLRAANPFIEVAAHGRRLDGRNVLDLIGPYDIILDCTDNQEAKLLLNDACYLSGKPLVQAAVYQWEGQIHVMLPDRRGQCLRCLWGDALSSFCQGACEDTGVVAVAPGVIGTLQAAEAIKLILGIESPLRDHVLLVDLMAGKTSQIKAVRRQDCMLCGQNALTLPGHLAGISRCSELDLETLTDQELEEYRIVDIREDDEREELMPSSILHVPLSSVNLASKQPFPDRFAFAPDTRLLLFCQKGIRSLRLAAALREQGFVQALSVAGGAAAVARRLS